MRAPAVDALNLDVRAVAGVSTLSGVSTRARMRGMIASAPRAFRIRRVLCLGTLVGRMAESLAIVALEYSWNVFVAWGNGSVS